MEVVDVRAALAPAISLVCAGFVFAVGRAHVLAPLLEPRARGASNSAIVLSMLPGALRASSTSSTWSSSPRAWGSASAPTRSACSSRSCHPRCGCSRRSTRSATWSASTHQRTVLRLLRAVRVDHGRDRLRREPAHDVPVLRDAHHLHLPLVIHEETPEAMKRGPQVPRLHAHRRRIRPARLGRSTYS